MSHQQNAISQPALVQRGGALALEVDGRPFLVLGGELHNSSSSSEPAIRHAFDSVEGLGLNTVLAPVAWNQFEPSEGEYDLSLIDSLLSVSREKGVRLIPLWFGAWKNGRSTYMPTWVRADATRFPRAQLSSGEHLENLSAFSPNVREADARAFAALMRHLRAADAETQTVIMVQVENEVGLLGDSRDRSALASARFAAPVPEQVFAAVEAHPETRVARVWEDRGRPRDVSWVEAFGDSVDTDEAFMATAFAAHVEAVTAAGKAEYGLPLFANAWLYTELETAEGTQAGGQTPGVYPSGGPLPHVAGIWNTLAPSIDLLAPDVYFGDFAKICSDYQAASGGVFIPEMRRDEGGVGDAFIAIGSFKAIGVSPFGIDSTESNEGATLADAYRILATLAERIWTDQTVGVHLHDDHPEEQFTLGDFVISAQREPNGIAGYVEHGYGLLVREGGGDFLVAGRGLRLFFRTSDGQQAEIVSVDELPGSDSSRDGLRSLNGDETDSGTVVKLHALPRSYDFEGYQIPTDRRSGGVLRVRVSAPPLRTH